MEIYNKRAITMLALIFTIIIMVIMVTTITISGKNLIFSTRKKEFAKEIYTIERKLKEYKFTNSELPIKDEVSVNLDNIDGKEQFNLEEDYSSGRVTLYKIDYLKADIENLKRGTGKEENDVYLISKTTNKVYYLKGVKIDKVYYTLTDELKESLNI